MVYIFAFIIAAIPVWIWNIILERKHRKGMNFFFWTSFFIAVFFAAIFLHFEPQLKSFLNTNLSLGLLGTSIVIGILIEYGKNWIVRIVGGKYFKGIDDVVDLSFASAIGFTFYENFFKFSLLFSQELDYGTPIEILKEIINREFFILPIHLCVSGIFGFYYGMFLFSNNHPEEGIRVGRIKRNFYILKGTILSTLIYGIFFMLSEMDPKMSDILRLIGFDNFPLDERLIPLISFGFFAAVSFFLFIKMEGQRVLFRKNLQKKK
jgi:hypothetical protein